MDIPQQDNILLKSNSYRLCDAIEHRQVISLFNYKYTQQTQIINKK